MVIIGGYWYCALSYDETCQNYCFDGERYSAGVGDWGGCETILLMMMLMWYDDGYCDGGMILLIESGLSVVAMVTDWIDGGGLQSYLEPVTINQVASNRIKLTRFESMNNNSSSCEPQLNQFHHLTILFTQRIRNRWRNKFWTTWDT